MTQRISGVTWEQPTGVAGALELEGLFFFLGAVHSFSPLCLVLFWAYETERYFVLGQYNDILLLLWKAVITPNGQKQTLFPQHGPAPGLFPPVCLDQLLCSLLMNQIAQGPTTKRNL